MRRLLLVEELEERIAPVITVSADPSTWLVRTPTFPQGQFDIFWIFYVGPGEAVISGVNPNQVFASDITGIDITGSTMDSALFVMDAPTDFTPNQNEFVYGMVEAGTLFVTGDITADSDIGYIAIDGLLFGDTTVDGTLGKLDVGVLLGSVTVTGDIYEIDVDMSIGIGYSEAEGGPYWIYGYSPVTIQADGNIGAIRAGVGLADSGAAVTGQTVLGGVISSSVTIRANADNSDDPGTIDLIEVRAGTVAYEGWAGYMGFDGGLVDVSAGPKGNVRFITVDGEISIDTPSGTTWIAPITVTSATPTAVRTVVDDSGGVMIISPQDTTFVLADLSTVTYMGAATYRLFPVNRDTQGPGAVIVNMSSDGDVKFNVSGTVEISRYDVGTAFPTYPEGIVADALVLGFEPAYGTLFTTVGQIDQLTGFAKITIAGPGECDVYYLTGEDIPIFKNMTRDGDIANISATGSILEIATLGRGGDIGATESITPYLLKGPLYWNDGDVAWVDARTPTGDSTVPWGIEGSLTRYNGIHGVYLDSGTVSALRATGAIGDVRAVGGSVGIVQANVDNVQDPDTPYTSMNLVTLPVEIWPYASSSFLEHTVSPFGKTMNTVGDGVFGRVFTGTGLDFVDAMGGQETNGGGSIEYVAVGEGLERSWHDITNMHMDDSPYPNESGIFTSSGVFGGYYVGQVVVSGAGRGIYGDVIGEDGFDDPLFLTPPYGIFSVRASNGAVIDHTTIAGGSFDSGWNFGYFGSAVTSFVGTVSASGTGSYIDSSTIIGLQLDTVVVSGCGPTGGIFDSNIWGFSAGLGGVSADGVGIVGSAITANGPAGFVETTAADGGIYNSFITAYASLGRLTTHLLENDNVYALTIGKLATLDYISGTTFDAGGVRNITVKYDIDSSLIRAAGPLDTLTVGGNINDSTITSVGFFGQMGTVKVAGEISESILLSNGSIKYIETGGGLDADITAVGAVTNNGAAAKATIYAGGTASGAWDFAHELTSVKTKTGNIDADITAPVIGTLAAAADVTGDINVTGDVKSITAGGKIGSIADPNSISIGGNLGTASAAGGGIFTNLVVTGNLSSLKAAGDIGDTGLVITVGGNAGKITAGSGKLVGDVNADLTVTGSLSSLTATGAITGDLMVGATLGTVSAKGVIGGDVSVTGDAGSIKAGGNVGTVASLFSIGGDLKTLAVGSSKTASQVLCDVEIGGNLGSLKVYGAFPAELSVTGDAKSIWIGGDAGQPGDVFGIGGNVGTFSVGKTGSGSLSDVLAALSVGGDLKTVKVTGDIYDSIDVGGSVNTITIGQVQSADITIGGDLGKITAGSAFLPTVDPHVYDIYTSGLLAGQLTVTGEIKKPPL